MKNTLLLTSDFVHRPISNRPKKSKPSHALRASTILLSVICMTLLMSQVIALTYSATVETESGSVTAPASAVSDSTAHGNQAVKFTAQSGGSCPQAKRTITASDVTNNTNSGYTAGTQVYVPDGPDPWGGCFPGPSTTGIPAGTTLSAYSGSCTLSTPNAVIDSKNITCDLAIQANNVTIKNSKIVANTIEILSGSLTLQDSEVDFGSNINGEGLKGFSFTILRANMYGGKRQVWCDTCTLQDSYLHDQLSDPTGVTHESSARVEANAVLRHNTLWCNAPDFPPDAGCSANQTGYPDFGPIHHNTMERNLYMATTGGYCSYGGYNPGKPYNNDPLNATYVHSVENVFQRGTRANDRTTISLSDKRRYTCGGYGVLDSFNDEKAGFRFHGNMWDDGQLFADDTDYPYGSWLSQMETP